MPSLLRLGFRARFCSPRWVALRQRPPRSTHLPRAPWKGPLPRRPTTAKKPTAHLSELLYTSAQVGVQYVGLEQLHLTKELFPTTVRTVDVGPEVGIAAGIRLVFVTLGARFQYGAFRDWDLWSLGAETALRVPLGSLSPISCSARDTRV